MSYNHASTDNLSSAVAGFLHFCCLYCLKNASKPIYLRRNRAITSKSCIMLSQFIVENYRSIDGQVELSLDAATGIKDSLSSGFTIDGNNKILNSIAFYGANSSGKSNFLRAISNMKYIVVHSVRLNEHEVLPYDPFLLSNRPTRPTLYQVVFSEGKTIFTYGFKYNREQIIEEWLLAKMPKKSLKELFRRTGSEIQIDAQNYSEASDIHGRFKLNGNRLFLSLVGQAGGEISNTVIAWFTKKLKVVSGLNDAGYANFTKNLIHDDMDKKARILEFVQEMKVGFSEVTTRSLNVEDMKFPSGFPAELISQFKGQTFIEVSSHHNVYDESGNVVGVEKFEIEEKESAGTNKIFNMAGPILDALTNGKVLCIDELDSQMHPMLTWKLVEIFNNQERNPYGAQLIFTTHDTNLLSKQLLRRDQIWFVEKDPKESTKIYPLKDYIMENGHKPRTDSNYEKNYLAGKYGAIPDLNSTIEDSLKEE